MTSVSHRPAYSATVTVRRVPIADAARLRALRLEMLADSPLAFLETLAEAAAKPHAEFTDRVRRSATGSHVAAFAAETNGRFVGHAGGIVLPGEPEVTVVFAVYLTPAWRGTGLLAELMDAVAEWSLEVGRPELMLEVITGNETAVRAYRRLGFVDTGVRLPHPTIPSLTELQMRRPAGLAAADRAAVDIPASREAQSREGQGREAQSREAQSRELQGRDAQRRDWTIRNRADT